VSAPLCPLCIVDLSPYGRILAADRVQAHVGRVYRVLALSVLSSFAGSRFYLAYGFNQMLASVLTFALLIAFAFTSYNAYQVLPLSLYCIFSCLFCAVLVSSPVRVVELVFPFSGGWSAFILECLMMFGVACMTMNLNVDD